MIDTDSNRRTIEHVVGAIKAAKYPSEPFPHLQLAAVFPEDIYSSMLEAMPVNDDYRPMGSKRKLSRANAGASKRTKLDLFPEYIRDLPPEKIGVWQVVGTALCSSEVREAFREALAPGLEKRFGRNYTKVGMYPIPILTRDVPGYQIGVHPDTPWKGMTIQLYLPRDRSTEHIGTIFHTRTGEGTYERATQMPFAPNSGYAFAVGKDTYHSVDPVGPEVATRDSILLTYFVDKTPLQFVRNRGRRRGNLLKHQLGLMTGK